MKKYLIIAIITFGANILNAQYVHDLFPCRDSSGTAIEGCIAYSDSLGRYIQVQDTSYCVDTNLVEEFLAANADLTAIESDSKRIVYRGESENGKNIALIRVR